MPSSTSAEAELPLAEAPEKTRWRLVRAIKNTRGMFALFPVESNLYHERRTAFFTELEDDLQRDGITLRRVTLQREAWNLLAVLQELPPIQPNEAVLVLGLEDTPEIAFGTRPGAERPPALNALNILREAIERHLSCPLILWCPPFAYDALLRHAPDFFDHYSALFAVMEDATETTESAPITRSFEPASESTSNTREVTLPRQTVDSDLAFYERRVQELTTPNVDRVRALIGLSIALRERPTGDIAEQRQHALGYALEAEQIPRESNDPIEHARALGNLGNAYSDLPSGDRDTNLRRAIECYESALRVYTEDRFPMDWAMTQNNLGTVYAEFPSGDRDSNLRRAIECYESALRVYTEDRFPMDWAATQNNLGLAYADLPSGDRDSNLRRAIECYESALRVYTEDRFPMQWAATQNNLGLVYADLPSGDRDSNFRRAIECFESALRVRTEDRFPMQWAMTRFNMGLLWVAQGERSKAIRAVEEAHATWERIGHAYYAQRSRAVLKQLKGSNAE